MILRKTVAQPFSSNFAGAFELEKRLVISLVFGLSLAFAGCARRTMKPIFPESAQPIQWPAAPAAPRIRYVGSLHSAADLRPARRPLATLGAFFLGKKEPEKLYGPRSVACTPDGNRVWMADPGGRCLQLFDLARREHKRIDRLGGQPLLCPVGLCLGPQESIFVCDSESVAIHRLSSSDGSWLATLRLPEEVLRPVALSFDEARGELWVVDALGHDLKVLGQDGSLLRIVGHRGSKPGQFNFPCDVAAAADLFWIADTGNHRVQAVRREGEPVTVFGQAGDASGDLAMPKSVALDPEGHVYVVDGRFENVQVFDSTGTLLLFFGEEGTGPGQFWLPGDIFIEPTGRIWVCDSYNRRVQVFQYLSDRD